MSASDLPDDLVNLFLRSIRNQFYQGHEKLFFQEKRMLLMAITYPASYLKERGVGLPATRYKALLTEVIRTINAHGNLKAVRSPGRYLLHAVQQHMLHQGDTYYEVGKRTRNALEDVMRGLKPRTKGAVIQEAVPIVPALAEAHAILAAAKGGRCKASSPALQPDLFGNAKGLQKTRSIQSGASKSFSNLCHIGGFTPKSSQIERGRFKLA